MTIRKIYVLCFRPSQPFSLSQIVENTLWPDRNEKDADSSLQSRKRLGDDSSHSTEATKKSKHLESEKENKTCR